MEKYKKLVEQLQDDNSQLRENLQANKDALHLLIDEKDRSSRRADRPAHSFNLKRTESSSSVPRLDLSNLRHVREYAT